MLLSLSFLHQLVTKQLLNYTLTYFLIRYIPINSWNIGFFYCDEDLPPKSERYGTAANIVCVSVEHLEASSLEMNPCYEIIHTTTINQAYGMIKDPELEINAAYNAAKESCQPECSNTPPIYEEIILQ